jgi:hypothetical protein
VSTTARPTRRIELYLRGDTYGTYDRQNGILDRVTDLEEAGVVADADVDTTWQRIRTPELDARDGAIETYEEFRTWAEANGYRLEPAFQRRQRSSLGTEVVHDVIVFPMASLAVYDGGELQAVFPCSGENRDDHFTVQDCLAACEDGRESWLDRFTGVTVDRDGPRLALAD